MNFREIFSGMAGVAAFGTMAALAACGGGDSARLGGHFIGAVSQPVYLERVNPAGGTPQTDTVVTNEKGEFEFRVALPDRQPAVFNLRHGADMVPLLIAPKERVNVMSFGDLNGYRVSGSPESELVSELHGILTDGARSLDSLSMLFTLAPADSPRRDELRREYSAEYVAVKRRQIGFIVENSSSLAAVYALYQRLPGDDVLFNGDTDYVYYQMVADSVQRRYPDSRYVHALEREIAAGNNQRDLARRLTEEGIAEVDYPDIELPNMYGQRVRLSSLAGKVIVIDFWSATATEGRLNNAEMKELWDEYSEAGLAVYQVSLDTSRPLWVNAVQDQKLPWVTVCDFRGEATVAARLYNVSSLPANVVIDREGNIVGRNLFGDALRRKLSELL
ncbi:MAG: TlpA family protein disulfide reductase [Alistipes sp.]|jgi:peroxiredoxin|nr:TlpA family protein disulfide reductase [Alistipes sp.]